MEHGVTNTRAHGRPWTTWGRVGSHALGIHSHKGQKRKRGLYTEWGHVSALNMCAHPTPKEQHPIFHALVTVAMCGKHEQYRRHKERKVDTPSAARTLEAVTAAHSGAALS